MKQPKIKRLFVDIETSPNTVYSWRIGYKINLSHENIIKERAVICLAYKWEGDAKIHTLQWKDGDDKAMLQAFAKVAESADEVVAHNGDRFDIPWLRTRCLFHNIPFTPALKSVDTLKLAKFGFNFNSNKLDYISKFLGLGNKIKTEYQLWLDVMNKSKKALAAMIAYCKHDVTLLEKVYSKLESYGPLKTHVAVLNGGMKSDCPACGSGRVQRRGQRVSGAGAITQRLSCRDCDRFFSVALPTLNRDNRRRSTAQKV